MKVARSRSVIVALLLVMLVVAGFFALVWAGQRRMMYFPFGEPPSPARAGLADAELVTFATSDGLTLAGWFVPARESPTCTVIVFNGNAGNRAFRAPLAAALAARGFSVLLFDYRGFGGNPGTPTEDGLARDARAARAYVASRQEVDPSRIAYFGESLGTAVATRLATEHPPAALILRSPFLSMAEIGQLHYPFLPVKLLLRDTHDTTSLIARAAVPLLVVAGDRDSIVPLDQSRRLFERATSTPKQLLVIPGADHNDESLLNGRTMLDAVETFLTATACR